MSNHKSNSESDAASSYEREKGSKKATEPTRYFHVSKLPSEHRKLVRKLLVEGATFEDVVETVAESPDARITQRAVEHFFRSSPKVQAARVARQLSVAEKLGKALRNPKSAKAKLAQSVLVLGLSGLNRGGEANRIKNAMQLMKEQKDERFKEADSQRKEAKLGMEEQESQIRMQSLQTKLDVATFQLDRLKQSIERQGKDKTLGPEIIQQINEIYGIVTAPGSGETSGDNCDA